MTRKQFLQLLLFAVSFIAYFPFAEWICTTRVGTSLFLWGSLVYGFPLLAAVFGSPVLIVLLFFRRTRRDAFLLLLLTVLFIPCFIVGVSLGHRVRSNGMYKFTERSQVLVDAVRQYEHENSSPPESLNDLVPNYLASIPHTGMMAYPDYRYESGAEAQSRYHGNLWVLSVLTPSGGINFDMMLYFPNGNYPEVGYGGGLERIGDWAYVHE